MTPAAELRPVPGYEGLYSVTRDGRVWSHPKAPPKGKQGRVHSGRWMSAWTTRDGAHQIALARNGHKYTVRTQKLARMAFGSSLATGGSHGC